MAPRSYLSLTKDELAHADALHRESIVIDASIVAFIDNVGEDLMLEDMARGASPRGTPPSACREPSAREVADVHEEVERKKEKTLIARTGADIEQAKREGKSALFLGPQDSLFLEAKTAFLDIAWDMGIRIIQLSYQRSDAADGCWDRVDGGLTNFSVNLVEAMNRRGMLVDLSHVGDRSTMEAIELSKQPCSFTHVIPRKSTPRDLSPYAKWAGSEKFVKLALGRGRTDEALKACVEKGGMVGVTPFFAKTGKATTLTDNLMDQVDYVADLVGADHVGFGSDLDYRNSVTRGAYIWKHPDRVDVTYHTAMDKTWGTAGSSSCPTSRRDSSPEVTPTRR